MSTVFNRQKLKKYSVYPNKIWYCVLRTYFTQVCKFSAICFEKLMNENEIQSASRKNTSPSYCFLKPSFLTSVDFCNCITDTIFEDKCGQRTQKTLS